MIIKLKKPSWKLRKDMYNLILDNQAEEIKMLLFKKGQSISSLYDEMKSEMNSNKVFISQSTFKNMLMESDTQRCNLENRLKVINLIFEYLDLEKINTVYESVKLQREKKIRSIMNILKSDYIDCYEFFDEEILIHEGLNLPKHMKTYWDSWKDN
jgi:hypothetical protein